ncbi:hypothetical protein BH23VER1_BH23VER1_08180 [soil metagenome]
MAPYDDHSSSERPIRRFRIATNVLVQGILVLALFAIANYLGFRHHHRWDLTRNRDYSISSATYNFLDHLKKDANITIAFSPTSDIFQDIRILAEEFVRHGDGHINLEIIDPARDPDRAENLKNRYGYSLSPNVVIVDVEGRTKLLSESDLAHYAEGRQGGMRLVEFRGEEALTSALLSVVEESRRQLYVLAGKGIPRQAPDGTDATYVLAELANKQNFALDRLDLADVATIPPATEGIILLGPRFDLTLREIRLLEDYWEGPRGTLLVLLDPTASTPLLDAFLAERGIRPNPDRVLYAESTPAGPEKIFRVQSSFVPSGSPIVEDLLGVTTEFRQQTCSLTLSENPEALRKRNIEVLPLLEASARFWGETNFRQALPSFGPGDTPPPVTVAAVAERGSVADARIRLDSSRLVVVGNAHLLDPDTLYPASYDFVTSSINWLIDREELVGIAPKLKSRFSLLITEDQRGRIFWIVGIILPASVIFLGMFVWSARRA